MMMTVLVTFIASNTTHDRIDLIIIFLQTISKRTPTTRWRWRLAMSGVGVRLQKCSDSTQEIKVMMASDYYNIQLWLNSGEDEDDKNVNSC